MNCRDIISNLIVLSFVTSSALPVHAETLSQLQQREQLEDQITRQISYNNSLIHSEQVVIEAAADDNIVVTKDSNLILGMNMSTIGALASVGVAAGSGVTYQILRDTTTSEKALQGAESLTQQLADILFKSGDLTPVSPDGGPASFLIQTDFKKLQPKVKEDVLALLRQYGSRYSKNELNNIYKGLAVQASEKLYSPAAYIEAANESHWQYALRRASLRAKGRYAAVVVGLGALLGASVVAYNNYAQTSEKEKGLKIIEGFINNDNEQGAVDYVKSCIADVALLNAQNAALETQLDGLR